MKLFISTIFFMLFSMNKAFQMLGNGAATGRHLVSHSMSTMMAKKTAELPANPVALVTGASRGIGKAIALKLGEAGCKVIVNYSSNEKAALEVCDEIMKKGSGKGSKAIAIKANCGSYEEINAMFDEGIKKLGNIDIVVNNAGITKDKLSIQMSAKDFTDVLDINLSGVFYCTQAAIKKSMLSQKRGRIINIASIVGQIGNIGQANYAAAKGGVIAMTKTIAREYGARNINCNAVCPGFIESDMTKDLTQKDMLLASIPLKRFGTPDEVAGLVKFLALDPAAAYITGHSFNVDGGLAIGAT